jgi:gluconokinase
MNLPSILHFYGLAGAGKNFVADLVGTQTGCFVYHADADLTPAIQRAITAQEPLTMEMRDEYFYIVAGKILELIKIHPRVAVTQATYKARHRQYLKDRIPGLETVCVTAPDDVIMARLAARGDAVTPDYATRLRAAFEPPGEGEKVLFNDKGAGEALARLLALYNPCTTGEI